MVIHINSLYISYFQIEKFICLRKYRPSELIHNEPLDSKINDLLTAQAI